MRFSVFSDDFKGLETDGLVIGIYTDGGLGAKGKELNESLDGLLTSILTGADFRRKDNKVTVLHTHNKLGVRWVLVVGLGDRNEVDGDTLRVMAAEAGKVARDQGFSSLAFLPVEHEIAAQEQVRFYTEGLLLGLYRFPDYKSINRDERKLSDVVFVTDSGKAAEEGILRGEILAKGAIKARELGNAPGNRMTPTVLAEEAEKICKENGLEFRVIEEAEMIGLGMNALLGVAKGSEEPPKLITMRYSHPEAKKTLALVGKGLTFDAGGISLKPSLGMEAMRMDKAGGTAVIGAMQAIAQLKPKVNVLALVPAVENLPDGKAQKPGDVVQAMNGKTIEIINTDAEGRLVLADAVAYAEQQGVDWIVDIATLTGAVAIALGSERAAIIDNNEELREKIIVAGEEAGEKYWPLPVDKQYRKYYKSDLADMKNSAGGKGRAGTIVGGLIIGEFVEKTPWAHLDIASVAWLDDPHSYKPSGANGFGAMTLALLAEILG